MTLQRQICISFTIIQTNNFKIRFDPKPRCVKHLGQQKNKQMNVTQLEASANTDPSNVETDIEFVSQTQNIMDDFS